MYFTLLHIFHQCHKKLLEKKMYCTVLGCEKKCTYDYQHFFLMYGTWVSMRVRLCVKGHLWPCMIV